MPGRHKEWITDKYKEHIADHSPESFSCIGKPHDVSVVTAIVDDLKTHNYRLSQAIKSDIITLLLIIGSNVIFMEETLMVIMNLHLDNFLVFNDFELCMSYPKKIVHSTIEGEHLSGRERFRYKKVVILMGANATGKTALGRILMSIFNFIDGKEYGSIAKLIDDKKKTAEFTIDLAFPSFQLYRIKGSFSALSDETDEYSSKNVSVEVWNEYILPNDSYERCVERLAAKQSMIADSYIKALEQIPKMTWYFQYPYAPEGKLRTLIPFSSEKYRKTLEMTLRSLDPRIIGVSRVDEAVKTNRTYIVQYPNCSAIIRNGTVIDSQILSSGTIDGIGVANMITSMKLNDVSFYYCDEKFAHIHSEAERAFLSVFIDLLGHDRQLFYTTHNSDILDMDLPKHSFAFMRRDELEENKISCIYASAYLKKNTDSLKNAVENDLFSSAPNVDQILEFKDT